MKEINYRKLTLVLLRISLGGLFLYAGFDKLINGFSASGFLLNATAGPFKEIFMSMANSSITDLLVVWGEVLIGLSLVLGIALRFAALMGSVMMALFYLAALPPEHGPISEHIIYILVFATLAAHGAGRIFGLDKYIEKNEFIKKYTIFKYLLG